MKYWEHLSLVLAVLLAALLVSACQPIVAAQPGQDRAPNEVTTAAGSLMLDATIPYGRLNGIDYHMIQGKFVGETEEGPFSAPFEIVTPVDSDRGNGRLVIEPLHFIGGAAARDDFVGPELLFGQGFTHAGICWQPPAGFMEEHPCLEFESGEGSEISVISSFAESLRSEETKQLVGDVDALFGIGFSNSAEPLQWLLRDPVGQNIFDLTILFTTDWPFVNDPFAALPADFPVSILPPESAGRVLVAQSEADVILFNGALHRDDGSRSNYRSYEVAGAQHVQGSEFPLGQGFVPVMRALFTAGDRWVTDGVEPPASAAFEVAPPDEIDPVYGRVTGIARDENLNALGGIRLPDVALGRSQFIATDTTDLVDSIWFGIEQDLTDEPLADGTPRFASHDAYVARFVDETAGLVNEGFLSPEEAYRVIEAASAKETMAE
jgi:hypothetical protein